MALVLNKLVPDFEATATSEIKFSPKNYQGKKLILYFYPKDMTPGCTTEAMQFRDLYAEFEAAGAVIFGVSRDNLVSHDKFRTHLELPFDLIADTEEKLCHMFGVVKKRSCTAASTWALSAALFCSMQRAFSARNGAASRWPVTLKTCSKPSVNFESS